MFSTTDSKIQVENHSYIVERWRQLYSLQKEYGERAIRYLLLTNSGGAIATLSFIGASSDAAENGLVKLALFAFVGGVICIGVFHGIQFQNVTSIYSSWQKEVTKYYADQISFDELRTEDVNRSIIRLLDYVFPYLSFIFFIAGCWGGGRALFSGGTG